MIEAPGCIISSLCIVLLVCMCALCACVVLCLKPLLLKAGQLHRRSPRARSTSGETTEGCGFIEFEISKSTIAHYEQVAGKKTVFKTWLETMSAYSVGHKFAAVCNTSRDGVRMLD